MYKYGLELELFQTKLGAITVPDNSLPLDGSGAMVELRTEPGIDLTKLFFELAFQINMLRRKGVDLSFDQTAHTFTKEEYWRIRKQIGQKSAVDFCNIYNKSRRILKTNSYKTSLQINISKVIGADENGNHKHGLLDVFNIVKRLDNEFKNEILASKRQPGEYAIKEDVRLEYRSLPSTCAFIENIDQRVLKVMNGL